MKKFYFHSKHDSKKEPIMTITALNIEDALECFCLIKKLSHDSFEKLYSVKEK